MRPCRVLQGTRTGPETGPVASGRRIKAGPVLLPGSWSLSGLTSIEVCAGAGGQALGLERAGFKHLALVEVDAHACATLAANRPKWNVIMEDLRDWVPSTELKGATLLTGGVPCPPFSRAGKQLGRNDERDLFPQMITLAECLKPEAIMIENVRGLLGTKFADYRTELLDTFQSLGYVACGEREDGWQLLDAADFGVPQHRRRAILVLLKPAAANLFQWPASRRHRTVGEVLLPLMAEGGWNGAADWAIGASACAPALVGGSKKHGGADVGPTSAKAGWKKLGVDGMAIAYAPPKPDFQGSPRLTVKMAAAVQGFPSEWQFLGGKTAAYRQVGNAFPPPVAEAVGKAIAKALKLTKQDRP